MPVRRSLDIDAYVERVRSGPCFVCEIVSGTEETAHHVVYRDDNAIAFLNRYPTLLGYVIVSPVEHRESVLEDFTEAEYSALQSVIRKVGLAVSRSVPTERLYILSLGSNQGNAHVHWHIAPLPPGVSYDQQQFAALMAESSGGYLELSPDDQAELAETIRRELVRSVAMTSKTNGMRFDHLGIPTTERFDGEIDLPHLKITVSDHQDNPFGIQWQRYWADAPYPELVKTVPHPAFEVEDLAAAIEGQNVIIEPNSPSPGVVVAFVEVRGAPIELMQIDHDIRPDL